MPTIKRICLSILISFLILSILHAQNRMIGRLLSPSGNGIEGAIIAGSNNRILAISSETGQFSFICADSTIICISAFGFTDTCLLVNNTFPQEIILKEKVIVADEVVVKGGINRTGLRSVQGGIAQLSSAQLRYMPSVTGEADPLRVLQLTPGVGKSDFTMGLNVRGSTTDQNLVLLNDAAIYNPNHLAGFLSVFNPLVVDKVSLIKSGIPVEYAGRASSVTIIESPKNFDNGTIVEGNIGILLSGLSVKSQLVPNTLSVQLAARKSYIDQSIKPLSRWLFPNSRSMLNNSNYGFYDVNAALQYTAGPKDQVHIFAYKGNDDFGLAKTLFKLKYNMIWGNEAMSARWLHYFNPGHVMKTWAYYSKGELKLYFGQNDFNFNLQSANTDYSLNHEHSFIFTKGLFKSGFQLLTQNIVPNKSNAQLNELTADFGTPNIFKTLTLSPYLRAEHQAGEKIRLSAGLRYNYYSHLGPYERFVRQNGIDISDTILYKNNSPVKQYHRFEPVLSGVYNPDSVSAIKISASRNYQFLQQVNVSAVALPVDFWMPASYKLKPQQITQFSFGYFRTFQETDYMASAEIFYKDMQELTEFKKGIISSVTKASMEENIITGRGRAYGIEIMVEKKQGRFNGWISYTLSRSERIFAEINNGKPYPSKYDRTHDISVAANYKLNQYWNASAVFTLAGGVAVTLPYGRYMVGQNIINQYVAYNSFRMPVYHRFDIAVSRRLPLKGKLEHSIDFGLYNAYSRLNPIFMYFHVEGDLEQYKLNVSPRYVSIFGLLPSVTYHFKF